MINRSIREKIYRIKWLHRLLIYVCHNVGAGKCRKIAKQNDYHKMLIQIKDSRKTNRCFIIGNGPSLTTTDLDLIKNEDCFATNGIFHVFDKTVWRPKYYCLIDRYASYTPEMIRDLEVEYVFLGSYYFLHNKVIRQDAICIRERVFWNRRKYHFSDDMEKYFVGSRTVSFFAMQLAVFLGYKEIYLLGFDNEYKYEKQSNGKVIDSGVKLAHFYRDDNPRNIVGEPLEMEKAYLSFKEYADFRGILVRNVTRGGKLEVFERTKLEDVVQ